MTQMIRAEDLGKDLAAARFSLGLYIAYFESAEKYIAELHAKLAECGKTE